jgi:hypothetical protein
LPIAQDAQKNFLDQVFAEAAIAGKLGVEIKERRL